MPWRWPSTCLFRTHTLLLPALPVQHLPKELRPAAQAAKRRAARVQERLSAVSAALRLLRAHADGKAAPKLCRALDALQRAKVRRAGSRLKQQAWFSRGRCGTAVPLFEGAGVAQSCVPMPISCKTMPAGLCVGC